MLVNPRAQVICLVEDRKVELVEHRSLALCPPCAKRDRGHAQPVSRLIRVQKILLVAFLFHVSYLLTQMPYTNKKSSCQNQKRTQQKVTSISGFGMSFVSRHFTCGARRYSALRSTLIPDSNTASKTGRVLGLCLSYSIILCKQAKRKANIRIPAGQRPVQLIYEQKQAKIFFMGPDGIAREEQ